MMHLQIIDLAEYRQSLWSSSDQFWLVVSGSFKTASEMSFTIAVVAFGMDFQFLYVTHIPP